MNEPLQTLERSGFIRLLSVEPDFEYIFRHALMYEAAYHSLVKQDRRHLHLLIGDLMEHASADRSDDLAPVLAHHFAEAGDDARAFRYFAAAGDGSARKYANAEAIAHYTRALEIAGSSAAIAAPAVLLDIYTRRGRALELSGRYDEALANYEQMLQRARASGDRRLELGALMALATVYAMPMLNQDRARAVALSQDALTLARALDDEPAQARIYWNQLQDARTLRDLPLALKNGEESLAIARRLNLREQLAFTLNDISEAYWLTGQTERAKGVLLEASGMWRELNNLPLLADNLTRLASIYIWCAEFETALSLAEEAYAISGRIHNLWGQSFAHMFSGTAYLETAQPGLALASMQDSITLSEEAGYIVPQCFTRAELARANAELGAMDRALVLAQMALDKTATVYELFGAGVVGTLAHVQLQRGEVDSADNTLRRADIPPQTASLSPAFSGMYFVAQGDLALAKGEHERALAIADELLLRHARFGIKIYLLPALMLKARSLQAMGCQPEALVTMDDACARATQWKAQWSLLHILPALAECESTSGRAADAEAHWNQARGLAERFSARLPDELRASFRAQPAMRALLTNG